MHDTSTSTDGLAAFRLTGRVALITGGGSERGIGMAIARTYAAAGASVGLIDIDQVGVQRNVDALVASGGQAAGAAAQVTDPGDVAAAVASVVSKLGPVDILVNAAGITRNTRVWETRLEDFDQIMAVNVRGGFVCLQAVLPAMMERRYGRIIWLSSISGKQGGGVFGAAAYSASKAAVIGLCQAVARELGPYGITSNALAPGFVQTGLIAKTSNQALEDELTQRVAASVPLGRVAAAQDVANAALFLASDAAAYVTGEIMDINGGAYFD